MHTYRRPHDYPSRQLIGTSWRNLLPEICAPGIPTNEFGAGKITLPRIPPSMPFNQGGWNHLLNLLGRMSNPLSEYQLPLPPIGGDNPLALSGYDTVADEGTDLAQQTKINFVGDGVTATDSDGNTVVTISGVGAGSWPTFSGNLVDADTPFQLVSGKWYSVGSSDATIRLDLPLTPSVDDIVGCYASSQAYQITVYTSNSGEGFTIKDTGNSFALSTATAAFFQYDGNENWIVIGV